MAVVVGVAALTVLTPSLLLSSVIIHFLSARDHHSILLISSHSWSHFSLPFISCLLSFSLHALKIVLWTKPLAPRTYNYYHDDDYEIDGGCGGGGNDDEKTAFTVLVVQVTMT